MSRNPALSYLNLPKDFNFKLRVIRLATTSGAGSTGSAE